MENFIHDYLRILDIDPLGYFIRLINISHQQSINLSNISIRQFKNNTEILNLYTFTDNIQPLLHNGEVVTIYSRHYQQVNFEIKPHIFIAENISRWLTNVHIQTEISLNNIVCDSHKNCSLTSTDIPLLFLNQPIYDSKKLSIKTTRSSNEYSKFIYPYCLSMNDITNPHTHAIADQQRKKRNLCYENNEIIKDFDSYPRRLTTSPRIIQLSKKT